MAPFKLPNLLVSSTDLARALRELGGLNDFFASAKVRSGGSALPLPRLSRMMDQLARENRLNLLDEDDRGRLMAGLKEIEARAPKLHISFAAEPSPKAFEQILVWLRRNIDQHVLVQIGLQPSIAAGCVLRSPNKVFDMSLRSALDRQEPYLARLIKGAVDGR